MTDMDTDTRLDKIIDAVVRELEASLRAASSSTAELSGQPGMPASSGTPTPTASPAPRAPVVSVARPTTRGVPGSAAASGPHGTAENAGNAIMPQVSGALRNQDKPDGPAFIDIVGADNRASSGQPGIPHPHNPDGLAALMESTGARIGTGRAGPRPPTRQLRRFQADLAVSKDALTVKVDSALLEKSGMFTVDTMISGGLEEYLLRPDLGRKLSEKAKTTIREKCMTGPDIQICVGDGLSGRAINVNLDRIFPVLRDGFARAGLSLGTPFFIEHCRVGVMNDIGDIVSPKVLILLIGERPGLGRADAMSAYMGFRPRAGHTDADRDVICNIYDGGGINPLEAGAYVVQLALRMMAAEASGIRLKSAGEEN